MLDHPRLCHLTPREQDVLAEFLSWLRARFGDHIAHVWLFGSKARGEYRLALNRAYYAVFHLTPAVLANLDVMRHRHSGVESAFHEYLIKPGHI